MKTTTKKIWCLICGNYPRLRHKDMCFTCYDRIHYKLTQENKTVSLKDILTESQNIIKAQHYNKTPLERGQ